MLQVIGIVERQRKNRNGCFLYKTHSPIRNAIATNIPLGWEVLPFCSIVTHSGWFRS